LFFESAYRTAEILEEVDKCYTNTAGNNTIDEVVNTIDLLVEIIKENI